MLTEFKNYLIYFLTGGVFTTLIIALENSDNRLLSGFATLMPVFTLVAYLFIGENKGNIAVSQHAWLVLVGTLVSWVPYMVIVALLSPKIGSRKAVAIGFCAFTFLALIYIWLIGRWGLFKAS